MRPVQSHPACSSPFSSDPIAIWHHRLSAADFTKPLAIPNPVIFPAMTKTSAIQLRRWPSPIAGASFVLISSCLLPAGAQAAGFSGSFAPANWILNNTNPDQSLDSTQYTCFALNEVACVEAIAPSAGAVVVVGSVWGQQVGGGVANTLRTTTWSVTNTGPNALISFDWALGTSGETNQIASYLVNLANVVLSSIDGNSGSILSLPLATGDSFGFRVTTSDNTGNSGILSISNFNATPFSPPSTSVPVPLPLAGGAAAFAFSRRLRRRIRRSRS